MARPEGSTSLDDPLEKGPLDAPHNASEKDLKRVRQVNRNLLIREHYPSLRDQHGRDEAFRLLSQRFSCSTATVRKVVYGER
jgi:hypothetical protein